MNPIRGQVLKRRQFLQQTLLIAAGSALLLLEPTCREGRIPLGVQLYSVREECKNDFRERLNLSKIGFKGVEFAGSMALG